MKFVAAALLAFTASTSFANTCELVQFYRGTSIGMEINKIDTTGEKKPEKIFYTSGPGWTEPRDYVDALDTLQRLKNLGICSSVTARTDFK